MAVAGFVMTLSFPHVATGQSGTIEIRAIAYSVNHAIVDATSTDQLPVPGAEVTVDLLRAGDVLVRFCAEGNMFGTGTGATHVEAEVDGVALPGEIQFLTFNDFNVVPRCFEWVAVDLGRGEHTVRMLWRLTLGSTSSLTGRFHESILTVSHR
jgi:hypothetical protein